MMPFPNLYAVARRYSIIDEVQIPKIEEAEDIILAEVATTPITTEAAITIVTTITITIITVEKGEVETMATITTM